MRYEAHGRGEWPAGIHWTPGEVRDVPVDWPGADGDPPAWLVKVAPPKPKKRGKAAAEPEEG